MRETCEGQLTYSKYFKVLSTFSNDSSNDKTTGNDGLTVEFYKFSWSEIGAFLLDSLKYVYFHGELSNSQKQVVITLIEKKDKDRRWLKNWRPISLVNVDVKIGSIAIAKRLETVLSHIIHYDQNAFVKERTIFELFFYKKIPLSRRVGYVMGGSVSGSVRDVCNTNQIGSTIKHQSNLLL